MLLDFSLLSMTELRNRPGEVLDRVAQSGEAFMIERNGRRQACLVPLSVFFPDVSPSRIAHEIEELMERGEEPRAAITADRELSFRFTHETSDNSSIELTVLLPHGYPQSCPRVYANSIGGEAPHRWSDGALCLYGVMAGWNPGKHTVLTTLELARKWVHHYDTWRSTGLWPQPEGKSDE